MLSPPPVSQPNSMQDLEGQGLPRLVALTSFNAHVSQLLSTAVAEMKQFAEDEALFSAWTKEHRARAAGAAGALPLNTNLSLLTGVH